MTVRVLRPEALDRLGTQHAVVEASAGTGKTFILEHLVVDLLLRRDAELEQILVVTFTEKATAELVQRVRATLVRLKELRADDPAAAGAPDEACWLIDDRARARLQRALLSFDRASISTIHGFCQRLLAEHAFLNQRLFSEEIVDEETAFHAAFLEALRRDAAADPEVSPFLAAWLEANSLERLEQKLLFACHRQVRGGALLRPAPLDEAAFSQALWAVPELAGDDAGLVALLKAHKVAAVSGKSVVERLGVLSEIARAHRAGASLARTLGAIDAAERAYKGFLPFICKRIEPVPDDDARLGPIVRPVRRVAALVVPLAAELVHRLLPRVSERLEARKREAGLYDFQDMLGLVARALAGDGARTRVLLETLRSRYRYALIDEFQDTDEVQWSIFRRIFLEGTRQVLTVIGDPKQAIYSFRGADVQTYLGACGELLGGRAPLRLTANYRSTAPLIAAYNAILDQSASPPLFRNEGSIRYDHPVTCGRPETRLVDGHGAEVAPVVVLDVGGQKGILTWQVKQALQARMVEELRAVLGEPGLTMEGKSPRRVAPRDVYVLTRTTRESREVGAALRAAQIPFAYFKQEKLFGTIEAREVLDLLRAIADPEDHTARARAWITAFFGLSLPDLAACEDLPAGHPLMRLLYEWKSLAEIGDIEGMLARVVQDSGLVRRELFLAQTERSLTNYLHVLEVLQAEAAGTRATLRQLAETLGAYILEARKPPGQQSDIQRLETDRASVQIMTIHHAKGLEADVVFLYGGLWPGPADDVHPFHDQQRRVARVGSLPPDEEARADEESDDEERRVLYVALTRARGRLYLPRYPVGFDEKLRGCYRPINDRLRELLNGFVPDERRTLFEIVPVPCPIERPIEALEAPPPALAAWRPPAELLQAPPPSAALQRITETRAGFAVTSYSAVKRRQAAFTPAAEDPAANEPGADAAAALAAELPPDELPRGRLSGSFLHEVLEELPLEGLRERPSLEEWRARPEVVELFERVRRRYDRRPAHLPHAQRLVHTALTAPVRLGTTTIPGLASAAQAAREMEFLYPIPERSHPLLGAAELAAEGWRIERGVVKGFIDLLFAHEDRVYVCDWKGDWLPAWEPSAVAVHAERNYATQARLYTLATLRLLGVDSEAAHDRRFGGVLYCFLRGMRPDDPAAGLHFHRPSWDEVLGWQREMLGDAFWRLG